MTSRWLLIALCTTGLIGAAASASAQKQPPAIAYTGPEDRAASADVRKRLAEFARERGLGFYDLAEVDPVAPDRGSALSEAIADYSAFRYAAAIDKLDALERDARDTGASGFTRRQLADVYLYRAMSHTEAGDQSKARDDLIRAATIFPNYRLDGATFRPSLRAAFERAQKDVAAGDEAKLVLELSEGCVGHIDGERAAAAVSLRPGVHFVRATCVGFEPYSSTVDLAPGPRTIKPQLTAKPSRRALALAANRTSAWLIWVDASDGTIGRYTIELVEMQTKESTRTWSLRIDDAAASISLSDVLTSLIETEFSAPVPDPVVVTRAPPTKWYERKWVWVAVGVVSATAVILPFALREDSANGFGASVTGVP